MTEFSVRLQSQSYPGSSVRQRSELARAGFSSGGLTREDFPSNVTQVVGRIHFLMAVKPMLA